MDGSSSKAKIVVYRVAQFWCGKRWPRNRGALIVLPLLIAGYAMASNRLAVAIVDLGGLGGYYSSASGINASGQIVGISDTTSGTGHAFLYSDGIMSDLGTLGGPTSEASSINTSRQVVGGSYKTNGGTHAFLYSGGVMTDLGNLGATSGESWAFGINASGQVVGASTLNGSTDGHAFLYSHGVMTDLGTLGGTNSYATGINDSGQVVGSASLLNGSTSAFLYYDGTMTPLGTLGGPNSYANGINAGGEVVGYSDTASGTSRAFLYSGGILSELGTLGGPNSGASSINAGGQVVGSSDTTSGTSHAFLYSGGIMSDLNSLLPANSGWDLISASGINDAGQIVGSGTYNGQYRAFLLTPAFYGMDVQGVPSPREWTTLVSNLNLSFVIADAWGGGSEKPAQQILASAPAGIKKAAYLLLNYDDPSQPGATQVGYALEALGSQYQPGNADRNLAFMGVDIEPICYQRDLHGNCTNPEDLPQDLDSIAARLRRIYEAVQTVERAGLNPVIYANQSAWTEIAGGTAPANAALPFGCLPLWNPQYD
jgi:probable HAF family extracellular repeat protein